MTPNPIHSIQRRVPQKRLLPVASDQAGQDQSPQDQTLVPESKSVDVGENGGELADLGDELGEGEGGDEAAEPAGEDGFGLG